jgi:protein-S-isoprenylcysteine O-methyltransferase Ste14
MFLVLSLLLSSLPQQPSNWNVDDLAQVNPMPEKLFVDELVLLILSLAFNYFGLSLSIAPGQYKAFGTRLNRPLARSPIWAVRGLGVLLVVIGLFLFYVFVTKWHSN